MLRMATLIDAVLIDMLEEIVLALVLILAIFLLTDVTV